MLNYVKQQKKWPHQPLQIFNFKMVAGGGYELHTVKETDCIKLTIALSCRVLEQKKNHNLYSFSKNQPFCLTLNPFVSNKSH